MLRLPNNRAGGHVYAVCPFDDPPKSRPNVPLALWEQPERVRVPVDAGPVRQPEFHCNRCRRAPANKCEFDLLPLNMGANRPLPHLIGHSFRSSEPDPCSWCISGAEEFFPHQAHSLYLFVLPFLMQGGHKTWHTAKIQENVCMNMSFIIKW
jgi:hypothetical protein